MIYIFEGKNPFSPQKKIKLKATRYPADIVSSEKEHFLYVSDVLNNCVWKIKIEACGRHEVIKWLTINYTPRTLSVSSEGHLLVFNHYSLSLMIYGSDAALLRSVQFPGDIEYPRHTVETSIGTFIILHKWFQPEYTGDPRCRWVVSEVSRDGQMVFCRFVGSKDNAGRLLLNPRYLSLESADRVFVTDAEMGRVILLDSDLTLNSLCLAKQEEEEEEYTGDVIVYPYSMCNDEEEYTEDVIFYPYSLCYDKREKQLIVGGNFGLSGVHVYNLS